MDQNFVVNEQRKAHKTFPIVLNFNFYEINQNKKKNKTQQTVSLFDLSNYWKAFNAITKHKVKQEKKKKLNRKLRVILVYIIYTKFNLSHYHYFVYSN